MDRCEIVLVRHLEDAEGYPCRGEAASQCADCGAALCDLHTEECDLCHEKFCTTCCVLHMEHPHAKPSSTAQEERVRRSA